MHSLLSQGLAGIQPVDIPGIENVSSIPPMPCLVTIMYCLKANSYVALQVDVTRVIEGHSSYLWMTPKILEQLELDNYFAVYKGEYEKPQEEKSTMD